jgi:hypothetical protein
MKGYRPTADQPKEGLRKLKIKNIRKKVKNINRSINIGLVIVAVLFAMLPTLNGYKIIYSQVFVLVYPFHLFLLFLLN